MKDLVIASISAIVLIFIARRVYYEILKSNASKVLNRLKDEKVRKSSNQRSITPEKSTVKENASSGKPHAQNKNRRILDKIEEVAEKAKPKSLHQAKTAQ